MMSYPSKTFQSGGLGPGEHGGMSYLTLGPQERTGPSQFPTFDRRVAPSFGGSERANFSSLRTASARIRWLEVRQAHCEIGVSHVKARPLKRL